ncbi:MAG: hypothetical protein QME32_01215 [Endomicrobiia bacterium]|nr:hypothetical protein [Endomicrobiia bacterium]
MKKPPRAKSVVGKKTGALDIAGIKIRFRVRGNPAGLDRYSGFAVKEKNAPISDVLVYNGDPYAFENDLRRIVAAEIVRRGGFLLHASGAIGLSTSSGETGNGSSKDRRIRRDEATVFCGSSGSGKSTLAGLFPARDVLSDELVAIVRRGKRYYACATPFRGMLSTPGPNFAAPLGRIFFLKKSGRLTIKTTDSGRTFRGVLKNILLLPSWRTKRTTASIIGNAAAFARESKGATLSFSLDDLGEIKKIAGGT